MYFFVVGRLHECSSIKASQSNEEQESGEEEQESGEEETEEAREDEETQE